MYACSPRHSESCLLWTGRYSSGGESVVVNEIPPAPAAAEARARLLYGASIIWDNHACLPLRTDYDVATLLARHRRSGATFVSLNLGDAEIPLETMLRMAAQLRSSV